MQKAFLSALIESHGCCVQGLIERGFLHLLLARGGGQVEGIVAGAARVSQVFLQRCLF